jgi:hypothetical protein
VEPELEDIEEAARFARAHHRGGWSSLFSRRYLPQLLITIALPTFNQLDGINSIMFYAPQLFSAMGQGESQALLMHLIIGAVNVVTTLAAVLTVDRCAGGGRARPRASAQETQPMGRPAQRARLPQLITFPSPPPRQARPQVLAGRG